MSRDDQHSIMGHVSVSLPDAYDKEDKEKNSLAPRISDLTGQEAIANTLNELGAVHGPLDAYEKWGLIQTSITRFGTLAVLVFFVGIISGLHRYTLRLATFYRAQEDTLMLLHRSKNIQHLEKISPLFTPKTNFGKQPMTPFEQVADAVSALSKLRTSGEKEDG